MKKLLMVLLAAVAVFGSCASGEKYLITGEWKGGDGNVVYLSQKIDKDSYEALDSAVVANGVFTLEGRSPIDRRTLTILNHKDEILLDGQPLRVVVTTKDRVVKGETKTRVITEITGSGEQDVLKKAKELEIGSGMLQFGMMMSISQVKDDSLKVDSVYRKMTAMKEDHAEKIRSFIESNADSYAITYMISDFMVNNSPLSDVERYYELLTPRVKQSNPGRLLKQKIELLRRIAVGGTAFDIELPAPDGSLLKLSSLRGKYVLVDFWASWCKPCLAEAPNVKEVYEKYHDKGFEVYGISLDSKKDLWVNAIEKHGLHWLHVSSLKGWKCPVAAQYNVTGIPKTFLLDPEGRVIDVDLRGEKLKEKIASLFDK
jgi:peroxiredoxin